MADIDKAGRVIAGLLGYNPGPGIYSRLERAVEAMPANVRVEELPGLLKRYKEGVPGWELNEVDFPGVVGDSKVVPRQDLLDAVRERSPVHTHREVVLKNPRAADVWDGIGGPSNLQAEASRLGRGIEHGVPRYESYGQGGKDYTELLLLQPDAGLAEYGSHWKNISAPGAHNAVAHARFDTHGDALRINELQSDLGIHNRKQREHADLNPQIMFGQRLNPASQAGLPFPLEDAWADLLIKRLALEAARKGHRAIEIASPRAIADKVGGNIENYEHFYGKVVPGAIERLGRKMGGVTLEPARLAPDPAATPHYGESARRMEFKTTDAMNDAIAVANGWVGRQRGQRSVGDPFEEMVDAMSLSNEYREQAAVMSHAQEVHDRMVRTAVDNGYPEEAAKTLVARAMPGVMRDAENVTALRQARVRLAALAREHTPPTAMPPAAGRRYIMSDEMRKRILTQGIGASLLAPIATMQDE